MTNEEKEKIGLIIIDTLYEYLTEKEIQGDVILESQFDDIADDLINKLFIHNVVGNEVKFESGKTCMMCRRPKENDGHTCCEDCGGLAF